jgi:hypothetical protein
MLFGASTVCMHLFELQGTVVHEWIGMINPYLKVANVYSVN